ncbi:MAG: 3'(2'),5'-bisphosphate nucleotidase [Magnetovibrio sp.]|nr:3'(2'),5'-bisphosphate nucleotidase [Magnetovibrio sp.]|tara:strand:+ start:266 stop:1048 length:783 start_codon:yes stop_codon:yes gene_type:complete
MLNIGLGLAKDIVSIARRAGAEIMKIYQTDFEISTKEDTSPVTQADRVAEDLISRAIREGITSKYPIVGEEAVSDGLIPNISSTPFWLIDPLDGTKEFISRNGEFTVNIALIENAQPILGVIHVPVKNFTYLGFNMGSFLIKNNEPRKQILCRTQPSNGLTALVSRSHLSSEVEIYLENYSIAEKISAGSSLKFCIIAEGLADIYPRMGRTMEWDTAAGHAIIKFAGGSVKTLDGLDLTYGKADFENPNFIASSSGIMDN